MYEFDIHTSPSSQLLTATKRYLFSRQSCCRVVIQQLTGQLLLPIQISNLRALMQKSTVATPCCDSLIPLSSCCTGEVECPECDAEYRFSWCSRDLCDEEDRPRNHCAICQTCRDYRDQHCSVSDQFSSLKQLFLILQFNCQCIDLCSCVRNPGLTN